MPRSRDCSNCGTTGLSLEDIFGDEHGNTLCEGCHDEIMCENDDDNNSSHDNSPVSNYGYHPEAEFHIDAIMRSTDNTFTKTTPVFGVELETEQPSRDTRNYVAAANFSLDCTNGFVYLKEDCSLREGFECVSHPATLDYWQNYSDGYQNMLSGLRKKGFRAWTTSRCGLHIHISKNSFVNPMHEMKFIYFIFRNKETMVRLVGRNSPFGQYNLDSFLGLPSDDPDDQPTWSRDYPKPTLMEIAKGIRKDGSRVSEPCDRNLAINRINRNTYELRIFRPSLLFATVLSYIEFTHCLFEYTKQITANDILKHEAINKFDGLANYARDNRQTYPNFIWKMHNRPNVSKAPDGWIDSPHKSKKNGQ